MDNYLPKDLLELLHDEEIIRLGRRAELANKPDLAEIFLREIAERDRKNLDEAMQRTKE